MGPSIWLAAGLATVLSCSTANAAERYKLRVLEERNPMAGGLSPQAIGSRHLAAGIAFNWTWPDFHRMAVKWKDGNLMVLPQPGTGESFAVAVNAAGEVVGQASLEPHTVGHAILWRADNSWVALPPLIEGMYAFATGINRNGQIAGCAFDTDGIGRAVVWRGNSPPTRLGTLPESPYACAWAIAGHGWVGGASYFDETSNHATIWKDGVPQDIGTLSGGVRAQVTGINSSGEAVGWSAAEDRLYQPFLWRHGAMVALDTLGGAQGWVSGINDQGVAVGSVSTPNADNRAVMWTHGQAIDLNDLLDDEARQAGWVLRSANGIDERGDVVGIAYNTSLASYPFILAKLPD